MFPDEGFERGPRWIPGTWGEDPRDGGLTVDVAGRTVRYVFAALGPVRRRRAIRSTAEARRIVQEVADYGGVIL